MLAKLASKGGTANVGAEMGVNVCGEIEVFVVRVVLTASVIVVIPAVDALLLLLLPLSVASRSLVVAVPCDAPPR